YVFINGTTTIPENIIIFFLVFTSLSANFIDLKDIQGDRAAGIRTLPVLTGERWGHCLIGVISFPTYIAAYWIFALKGCFWLCLIMGVLQYLLVNRKPYSDRWVMALHTCAVFFIICYKILNP
ncbi:MAG: UbiA family prenyltransferase, partial [Candidatus Omnitrophica bacterium]|nr:UbiA family prenyltransferase [Candidatus Omnitrophota bacterium]